MTRLVFIAGRHGTPLERAAPDMAIRAESEDLVEKPGLTYTRNSYLKFHKGRVLEIRHTLSGGKSDGFTDGRSSNKNAHLSRQSKVSIGAASAELAAILDEAGAPLPSVLITSPWKRAIATGQEYLAQLYENCNAHLHRAADGETPRVTQIVDASIGPAAVITNEAVENFSDAFKEAWNGNADTLRASLTKALEASGLPLDPAQINRFIEAWTSDTKANSIPERFYYASDAAGIGLQAKASGISGPEIFKTLADNPEVRAAVERAEAKGQDTVTVQVVSHDCGPYNMMASLLGPERMEQEQPDEKLEAFRAIFDPLTPLAGVAVAAIEVDSLDELRDVQSIDPKKIRFLGSVSPRDKLADIVDEMVAVLEASLDTRTYRTIPLPSAAPGGARWSPELITQLIADLQHGSKVLRDPEELVIQHLYPKESTDFTNDGSIEVQHQRTIDTLRNWSLALEFVERASQLRDSPDAVVPELVRDALNVMGNHQTVTAKLEAIGKYTEVSFAENVWVRRDDEITPTKPTVQPPAPIVDRSARMDAAANGEEPLRIWNGNGEDSARRRGDLGYNNGKHTPNRLPGTAASGGPVIHAARTRGPVETYTDRGKNGNGMGHSPV